MQAVSVLLLLLPTAFAAQAPEFQPPSAGPLVASPNYVGMSNTTLPQSKVVPGKQFDRFIQVWMENTNFESANSTSTFINLAKQGVLLDQFYALHHPSYPNYVAAVGGDFFGMGDDGFYNIPSNISTIVDLLEAKNISWASYQENMPSDGFSGFNFTSNNYLNSSAPPYTYYVRKHNPTMAYDSVASVSARAALNRNLNDFAADVNASVLPQWVFVTPNLVNDAHDTNIDFGAKWIDFWLTPLLSDPRFNDNKTLIILTFDENETYTVNNRVWTLLLGGAVPENLRGTTDSTYYTHYSALSSIEANWALGSLGRGDTNKTVSNVFSFVAAETGYTNLNISGAAIPLTNATGTIPGPLNRELYVPFTAPNVTAVGAGGGAVFLGPGLNVNLTVANAPAPQNLTALNETVPAAGPLGGSSAAPGPSSPATLPSSALQSIAAGKAAIVGTLGALVGSVVLFL